jgi:hypothetical protein
MIYKRKRIDAQTRNFGNGHFALLVRFDEADLPDQPRFRNYYHFVGSFWSDISTKDLKLGWSARFFQQKICCRELDISEGRLHEFGGKDCSFKSMPKPWQDLFEPILDAIVEGKFNEFDFCAYNRKLREESLKQIEAMTPAELEAWQSKVNPPEQKESA